MFVTGNDEATLTCLCVFNCRSYFIKVGDDLATDLFTLVSAEYLISELISNERATENYNGGNNKYRKYYPQTDDHGELSNLRKSGSGGNANVRPLTFVPNCIGVHFPGMAIRLPNVAVDQAGSCLCIRRALQ